MINLHITLTPFRNESRVLKETNSLVKEGIVKRVLIAALHESGLHEYEEIDPVRSVWRVKLRSKDWSRNFFVQLAKYMEFCWRVCAYAKKNHVGMVNVHSLALLPLGCWLKVRLGAKLVYDAHELETETNGTHGFRKTIAKLVERALIRFVDLTIVVGWEIEKWYREQYQIESIVTVLNCPPYREFQRTNLLRDEFNIPEHRKIVLYQGGLARGRGIEFLLEAFENIDKEHYIMIFMGYGDLETRVKNVASRCTRILFKPAVSPSEVLKYTASADIGIHVIPDTCLSYRYCLPNKLFECVMARLPVVVSNLPEMANVVNTFGIGAVMESWDAESLFQALRQVEVKGAEKLAENMSKAAKVFSWQMQEEAMVLAYKKHFVPKGD